MSQLAGAALALVLAACAADAGGPGITVDPCEPVVVVPAADAAAAEVASIGAALTFWNQVAGTRLTLDAVDGAPRVPVLFRDAAPNFFGLYDGKRSEILINRSLDDAPARAVVVAHELGHAFGLVHVSDRRSVMVAGNITVAPSDVDVQMLAVHWGTCPRP